LQLEQRALRNDAEVRLRALERMQAQSAGENLTGRIVIVALEQTVAHLSQAVARLEEARATIRAEVRAEVTAVVSELRVRFAEEQKQRPPAPPALSSGKKD
jgi:DhnA family fructose-bisphosphate aldolase class Ia